MLDSRLSKCGWVTSTLPLVLGYVASLLRHALHYRGVTRPAFTDGSDPASAYKSQVTTTSRIVGGLRKGLGWPVSKVERCL